jgi:hypothetical protein
VAWRGKIWQDYVSQLGQEPCKKIILQRVSGWAQSRVRVRRLNAGPRATAELVPKFHLALHASNAALPMVALEISHCTNVTSKYGDLALQVGGVSDETVK